MIVDCCFALAGCLLFIVTGIGFACRLESRWRFDGAEIEIESRSPSDAFKISCKLPSAVPFRRTCCRNTGDTNLSPLVLWWSVWVCPRGSQDLLQQSIRIIPTERETYFPRRTRKLNERRNKPYHPYYSFYPKKQPRRTRMGDALIDALHYHQERQYHVGQSLRYSLYLVGGHLFRLHQLVTLPPWFSRSSGRARPCPTEAMPVQCRLPSSKCPSSRAVCGMSPIVTFATHFCTTSCRRASAQDDSPVCVMDCR